MEAGSSRYSRQVRFEGIGSSGQERIGRGTAVVVGLGALGSVSATYLARAGTGRLRLVDRDLVEWTNLQRQLLYTEADARGDLPKAVAAATRLGAVNSEITIEMEVTDLTAGTADRLLAGADVLVDGTDNFETRYLLNEWSVREGVPWIYGAAVGSYGLTLTIRPGDGPCLACAFESAPPPEFTPTCETAGVVGPIAGVIAAMQAAEALKILAGRPEVSSRKLTAIDLWRGTSQQVEVERDPNCAVCRRRVFRYLEGRAGASATRLCGRNTVQVQPRNGHGIDLDALARRLAAEESVTRNAYLVRARVEGYELAVFADGRVLVSGTDDPAVARSLVSRYVGS